MYYLYWLYIPENKALQSKLFKCFYKDLLAGYFRKKRILELFQQYYYWPNIDSNISSRVSRYRQYQFANIQRYRPYSELQLLPVPEGPWQELSIDFITDLLPSRFRGYISDTILVIVDCYSKMLLYIPAEKI